MLLTNKRNQGFLYEPSFKLDSRLITNQQGVTQHYSDIYELIDVNLWRIRVLPKLKSLGILW